MPPEPQIACSLSAHELPARLEEMAAVGVASLISAETRGRRAELRFRRDARGRLSDIVAAERECCGFLAFALADHEDIVVLSITAPAGAEPSLEGFVAAFRGQPGDC